MIIIVFMIHETQRHRVLASDSRQALLDALRGAGRPLSVAEAAAAVKLTPSTTRFHLELLVSAGLVESIVERRSTPGRPALRYQERALPEDQSRTTAAAAAIGEDNYQQLASILAGSMALEMDPFDAAREAGRRWSHLLTVDDAEPSAEPVAAVVEMMDKLGFAPDRPAAANEIRLRRCPFEVVAREHRQVVCGVHQGLLEETFDRLGGRVHVAELAPFVNNEPLLCVVHLKRSAGRGRARQATIRRENAVAQSSALGRPDRAGDPSHA
jgi:predicted ArsR family transcriptional regulator